MIKCKVESSNLIDKDDDKTISTFTNTESTYNYNTYYLKYDADDVTMTLTNGGGFEFKKSGTAISTVDHKKIKLLKRDDNQPATAATLIPMSAIKMTRPLSEYKNHQFQTVKIMFLI